MRLILALLGACALSGCLPDAGTTARYPAPWPAPYHASPVLPPPGPPPAPPPTPEPAKAGPSALDIPARPGPFGRLAGVTLGQRREEVEAQHPGIVRPNAVDDRGVSYSVEVDGGRVVAMRAVFDRDPKAELAARWGEPVADGTALAWLVAEDGLRVVLDSPNMAVYIRPYTPLSTLLRSDGGKLSGVVAEVLAMNRKAFDARFPAAKVGSVGRDSTLELAFPPVEAADRESEIEARFDASGALVAVELTVSIGAEKAVGAVLAAVHGAPKDLPLCPAAKRPCVVAAGVYQAEPVVRYGKGTPEVTSWPHDWARLTVRWSRSKTRTDHFTTITPPDRVRQSP